MLKFTEVGHLEDEMLKEGRVKGYGERDLSKVF